jgi:hypothetical protein
VTPADPAALWRRRDAVAVVTCDLVAAVLLVVAWWGASRALRPDGQDGWFGLAVAGLIVAGVGNGVWLLTARAAVTQRSRSVGTAAVAEPALALAGGDGFAPLVGTPTLTRYHRPDCRLAAGRPMEPADRTAHERLGRRPCGMCRP